MLTLAAADTLAAGASVGSQVTCTVFGMELNGTTETYKVLDQRQLAASPATIYTAPALTTAFIKTIMVNNNDTVTRTFRLFRGGTANANAITPTFSLLPGGCAVYEDALGWQFFNSAGQMLTATGNPPAGANQQMGPTGTFAESIPRNNCFEVNTTAPTASGTLWMQSIFVESGRIVNNILWHSATTAANTPTNNIIGLYDINRNLLAQTANQTTAAWAANTMKTIALTAPYTIPSSGLYYVGFLMTATAVITSKGTTARTASQLAGQAPILQGTSSTGLTTALPNPAAAITVSTASAWCALS